MNADRPLLSVVVPVFNQASSIIGNLDVIRARVSEELQGDFEIVVVSDGSIDDTEGELLGGAPRGSFRVFHYDRNLGKGYAVKLGALEARGDWIGFVDADLDLDPASLATYVRRAVDENLDFAIGSKRHHDSQVHYPRSRVVASWMFQQLVRLLFRLNVRDTQVGLKVFRREVADQVLPLLMVKRYAFDIELLAVARAFGFTRIEEMPIRLDYQFTGSGVRSRAVLRALVDTAAIFYRLRILRYYQRRRRLSGAYAFTRPRWDLPSVSVLLPEGGRFRERDFPAVEVIEVELDGSSDLTVADYVEAAEGAHGAVIGILGPGVHAAGNWLSATTPFLARSEIGAVVTPRMAPVTGGRRARAAAAVVESRVGAGLGYFRHTPGNVRYVEDFPASGLVLRRNTLLELGRDVPFSELVQAINARGARVLYTPETVVVADAPALFRPHLGVIWARALAHGRNLRRGHVHGLHVVSLLLLLVLAAVAILVVVLLDATALEAVLATVAGAYVLATMVAAAAASLRHRSVAIGGFVVVGIVATHLVYSAGFMRGLVGG